MKPREGFVRPNKPSTFDILSANAPGYYGRLADVYAERGGFPELNIIPPKVQQNMGQNIRQGFGQIGQNFQNGLAQFRANFQRNLATLFPGFARNRRQPTRMPVNRGLLQLGGK